MMESVRHLGFGARIVSGYHAVPASGGAFGSRGSTHAWVEIFVPGPGWIAFDPTHSTIGDRALVPIGRGRSIRHVTPISGSYIGVPDDLLDMEVSVVIR